ncbi:MAG: flagellar hook-basal body complex protein FliE [Novosphingobium sp. 28-62-57]|uniref:flagellar hook-basal body complex protein FliE n=1 Tax=unclassified Novosphingobium TaxID=2644732 RepID=UPI000BCD70A3|nr:MULTISPECIES: flagellar hook-basal body complex protein FliE [unclassified Novosphingobium]OYW47583.1 MAG: flagellar hook-basal body complex protein FliE [Novosphingobium sp. 12-63-9]OYZ08814.1 MAG: flagellar hook-basal body complex protein FliE [Novosphingobium sp. 28-62-57]OZA36282.1 MAG: flagellar hook-basal body complex protein FliE [Novosphingobium sp. 17-62-9]HQS70808.1 flagellar hook-basal body complex protein FliE [Novosphingobium sp.]
MSGIGGIGGRAAGIQDIMALRQQIMERSQLLQQVRAPDTTQGAQASSGPAGSFTDTLKGALDSVNATQQKSSEISAAYERGEVTDIAKVMLARQESGVAFEATLQVRNKLLNAYQDIMRMGV